MEENKERQSNIELCRIISILLVVLVHSNFSWTGTPGEGGNTTFARFLVQAFSIIGVNVFILITGWFSTTIKLKSIVNLIYICLFYSIVKIIWGAIAGTFVLKDVFFISNSNWFVVSYLGLVFLTPALNSLDSQQKLLKWLCIFLLVFEVYFSFFPALAALEPGFNHGYSVLSFVVLYLIARYMKLYGISDWIKRFGFVFYFILSILIGLMAYLVFIKGSSFNVNPNYFIRIYDYNNPMVIVSAICFFLGFENLKINYSRFINHIAKSVLAVLLIHGSAAINPFMKQWFTTILDKYSDSWIVLSCLWLAGILGIFILSVLIDQIRIISYKFVVSKLINKIEIKLYKETIE